jgi:hypothetical protein
MFNRYAVSAGALAVAATIGLGAAHLASAPATPPAGSPQAAFLAENDAAMTRMMGDMVIQPSGDIDRDFALMMIPHHQGAVDMAVAQLRYGRNEQLRRIAQEIIVEQMQEIAAMRMAIGEPLPALVPAPTQPHAQSAGAPAGPMSHHHHDMNVE